jgi:transcriptional regulator with XRE-family HTH domain
MPDKPITAGAAFATRTREVRERRGWTQDDLAERLCELGEPMDRYAIAKIEQGVRRVDVGEALAIAAALGVSLPQLLLPLQGDQVVRITEGFDDPEGVEIAGPLERPAKDLRAWIRGAAPLLDEFDEIGYLKAEALKAAGLFTEASDAWGLTEEEASDPWGLMGEEGSDAPAARPL